MLECNLMHFSVVGGRLGEGREGGGGRKGEEGGGVGREGVRGRAKLKPNNIE